MGLGLDMVTAIYREHSYAPITGDVLLIGRQSVYLTPEQLIDLAQAHGLGQGVQIEDIEMDESTIDRRQGYRHLALVHDRAIFKMLGNEKVKALDHTRYEGAEIVHNLNLPVPDELKGCADFIVDGSTLDNVFSPGLTIRNYADLLRPGGRMLTVNLWSNHHDPYVLVSPLWFLDYFAVNNFVDCKVYVVMFREQHSNAFALNVDCLLDRERALTAFVCPEPYEVVTIVMAEKGPASTTDMTPTQQHYRSEADWASYRRAISRFRNSPRPHLVRSNSGMIFADVTGGHLFVDGDFIGYGPSYVGRLEARKRDAEKALFEAEQIKIQAQQEAEQTIARAQQEADQIKEAATANARLNPMKRLVLSTIRGLGYRLEKTR